eukprot:3408709-Heterocapsa_arctica.AAC.1
MSVNKAQVHRWVRSPSNRGLEGQSPMLSQDGDANSQHVSRGPHLKEPPPSTRGGNRSRVVGPAPNARADIR